MAVNREKNDRFSLLLLEEGEYYFKDYSCFYHPTKNGHRVAGHLKLCSASIFFVPRNVNEPIFRVPFASVEAINRVSDDDKPCQVGEGEECFYLTSSLRVDMKMGNRNVPYVTHKGSFTFEFSLHGLKSSSLGVLSRAQELFEISKGKPKERFVRTAQIIREHEESLTFNKDWLKGDESIALEVVANRVTPLVSHPGRAVITGQHLYFQPFNVVSSVPIQEYKLSLVTKVMPRIFNLEPFGLEVFFRELQPDQESVYFTFKSEAWRDKFQATLLEQGTVNQAAMRQSMTSEWVKGKVSNYDYLMWLNREAGRSFNDLTQYPVFPWVITDFSSPFLDLSTRSTFRDLSKPIGALNPRRLDICKQRYHEMQLANMDLDDDNPMKTPPFLYGCHYSTPGFVVYYLLRANPQLMLRLQNGKFDMADRLLWSVGETFTSVMNNSTDLKELTPEFYSFPPTFLMNTEGLDFGVKQNGEKVDYVELPPWAKNPHDFIHKMREALESPFVSSRLHLWIDLIFGVKQRGSASVNSDNVFHHLTYDDLGRKALKQMQDPHLQRAIKLQMMEFGRTPRQLFTAAHPQRHVKDNKWTQAESGGGRPKKDKGGGLFSCCGGGPPKTLEPAKSLTTDSTSILRKQIRRVTNPKSPLDQKEASSWIEEMSKTDKDALKVGDYRELLMLVAMCQDPRPALQIQAVQVMHSLAVVSENCTLLLNAGALEPIVDVLCGDSPQATEHATFLLRRLAATESPLLSNFNMSALAALLELLVESAEALRVAALGAICALTLRELNRVNVLKLTGLNQVCRLLQAKYSDEVRIIAATTCLHLTVDDNTKCQLVELGGLQLLIEMCEQAVPLQIAAMQCLAELSTSDMLKQEIAARGGLRLLAAASCAGDPHLQQAAADAVQHMCTDTNIISLVVQEEGLWSVISMAQSPHPVVQQYAAKAFWHLAMETDKSLQILEMGGLQTLLRLSMLTESNPHAAQLAEEALVKLSEHPNVRNAIAKESLQLGKMTLIDSDVITMSELSHIGGQPHELEQAS